MVTGGLVDDSGTDQMHAMTAPTAGPAQQGQAAPSASESVESHLDSFFQGSGWTREDLQLVLTGLNTLLIAAWVLAEVR
jgi:hypothetical protein